MKRVINQIVAAILILSALTACSHAPVQSQKLNFKLASMEEGQKIISTSDTYTQSLNEFDLISRVQEVGLVPTEESYLELGRKSVLEWTEEERQVLKAATERIQKKIDEAGYRLPIPEEITLVKTSMVEEGGALGYTRGNCIFLISLEKVIPAQEPLIDNILTHEIFHILSRNDANFRKAMYQQIGFKILKEEIPFNEKLSSILINNPDVKGYDSYSKFTIEGKKTPCTIVFYARQEYEGGPFYSYGDPGLVPLQKNHRPMLKEDGSPLIYHPDQVEDFFDKIGKNTTYIINPEEILADNFAFALMDYFPYGKNSPEVTQRIRKVMRGAW